MLNVQPKFPHCETPGLSGAHFLSRREHNLRLHAVAAYSGIPWGLNLLMVSIRLLTDSKEAKDLASSGKIQPC